MCNVIPGVDAFDKFQAGQMGKDEAVFFIQLLIDGGLAWLFPMTYANLATHFIAIGLCRPPKYNEFA